MPGGSKAPTPTPAPSGGRKMKMASETELYRPVHDYLVKNGYTVRSEVNHCDIAAVNGDDLIVIELKRVLSLALIAQGVRRQEITDSVYIAIPRPSNKSTWLRQSKDVRTVLRRLEIGLILVSLTRRRPEVEIIFHPLPAERRKRKHTRRTVLREIEKRSMDLNEGGSCRTKIMTAYRENAIHIACRLAQLGPLSPKTLRGMGTGEKTLSILRSDFYGWFERVDRGVYALRPRGRAELERYPELVEHYGGTMVSSE